MRFDRLTKPQRVAAVCMLVVAIAAFLPWVSIFGIGVTGIEGDGQITLVCAVIGLVLLALQARSADGAQRTVLRVIAYAAAIVALLVALFDMNGAAAIGLYLTLFASVGWVGSLVWHGIERKQRMGADDVADPSPT